MQKTILITGGTGYIGSHTVVEFEKAGYKTVILDNLSNSDLSTLDGIKKTLGYCPDFYETDINSKLDEIFKKYNFDGVLHFAGLKAVGESCKQPLKYFQNNVSGTINLLNFMKKYGSKKLIFSSSATVYNHDNPIPYEENMPIGKTTNPYGKTKYIIERILEDMSKFNDFKIISLRYFNPIGAHPKGFLGENPNGIPNNLLPYIMKVLKGELPELKVFGNDYPTKDGTGIRDYIDINDLVSGHLKAYSHLGKIDSYDVFNLGTGKGTSVLEIIKFVEQISGKSIPYKIEERRDGDLAEFFCNPQKANKILNWKNKNNIKNSIENSIKFYNKNNNMKKIAFLAPTTKGGPYFIYKELVKGLNNQYGDKIKAYFFCTKKDRIKLHFQKYDTIFSVIPFLFKPIGTKKYYYNIHGNFEIEKKRKKLGNKLLYLAKPNIKFCNKIILNSMFLADKISTINKYKNKIIVIPNPISFNNINQESKKKHIDNEIKILTVSSTKFLEKGMGIVDLGKQLSKITDKKIIWTIIAGGNKKNKLAIQKELYKNIFHKNIKIKRIDWLKKEELIKYYKKSDIFLYGSRLDTRGMTTMEAMSYGLPIILLEYELWKYIYPKEIITKNINEKLNEIIKKYALYSKISINYIKRYNTKKIIQIIYSNLI